MIFALLRLDRVGAHIVKSFTYYLFTSLIGLFTLVALKDQSSLLALLFLFLGGITVFFTISGGIHEGRKQAPEEYNLIALEGMRYDSYYILGSLLLYMIVIFFPEISTNTLVRSFQNIILWVYRIPVVGFLLGIGGIFYMLGTLSNALLVGGMSFFWFVGKVKGDDIKEKVEEGEVIRDKIKCNKCNKENNGGSNYCKFCGSKL